MKNLTPGSQVVGLAGNGAATIVQARWHASSALTVTFRDESGRVSEQVLFRADEERLDKLAAGRPWSFDADGELFRLASEARRIELAWMFDPFLAVQTSNLDPLPHQIDAVYEHMLPRQPLRFLLADDPGAGKTIMAGLLIKELQIRGDVERCLVIAPGGLVEQWQDELSRRFGLSFEIFTRHAVEAAETGNPFAERPRWLRSSILPGASSQLRDRRLRSPFHRSISQPLPLLSPPEGTWRSGRRAPPSGSSGSGFASGDRWILSIVRSTAEHFAHSSGFALR